MTFSSFLVGLIWGCLVWFKLPKAYHAHFGLIVFGGCVVIAAVWQLVEDFTRRSE